MKTILITGATDGLGLAVSQALLEQGHYVLMHGRTASKLSTVLENLKLYSNQLSGFVADLTEPEQINRMLHKIQNEHAHIDVLINNAGVYLVEDIQKKIGIDVRFMVNTIAPFYITQTLLPLLKGGRIINLSSAAQAKFDIQSIKRTNLNATAMEAYAQSKAAIACWTFALAKRNPNIQMIAVNPGSLLATKMVRTGFGIKGNSLENAVQLLCDLSLHEQFSQITECYFDGDIGTFSALPSYITDPTIQQALIKELSDITNQYIKEY